MAKRVLFIIGLFLIAASAFAATTISNSAVIGEVGTTVTFQWTTSTASTTQLYYGNSFVNGSANLTSSTPLNATPVTTHTVQVTNMNSGVTWYYQPVSVDSSGVPTLGPVQAFQTCGVNDTGMVPVSGTTNNYYEYGQYSMTWVNTSGWTANPTVCGVPLTTTYSGNLDGSSSFNTSIPSNLKIVPSPSAWTMQETGVNGSIGLFTTQFTANSVQNNLSTQLQTAAAALGSTALVHVFCTFNGATCVPTITGGGGVAGVTSLNSLNGALTIAAGTNVTLGTSGNTITINSSGGGGGGSGLTSVGITVPGWLTAIGSPLTANGTISIIAASGQTSHQVIGTCGTATQFSQCVLTPGDIPTLAYLTGLSGDVTASGGSVGGIVAANVTGLNGVTLTGLGAGLLQLNSSGQPSIAQSYSISGNAVVGGSFVDGVCTVAYASSVVFNAATCNTFILTLTGNVTSSSITGQTAGQQLYFVIFQDSTGGRTFAWPTSFNGATPVTLTANAFTSEMFFAAGSILTSDNFNSQQCITNASPAVCLQANNGFVAVPTGNNPTLTVQTSAIQANSQVIINPSSALTIPGTTCNTTIPAGFAEIATRVPGVSFTIQLVGSFNSNPECVGFVVVNP